MDQHQNDDFRMIKEVATCLNTNHVIVDAVADLATARATLNTKITSISGEVTIQTTDNKPITSNKNTIRTNLEEANMDAAGALSALGIKNSNIEMEEEFDYPISYLQNQTELELESIVAHTFSVAAANSAALLTGGYTAPMQTAFGQLITDFGTAAPAPEAASEAKETATINVQKYIDEAKKLISKSITKWMRLNFRVTQKTLFQNYLNSLAVFHTGHRTLSMFGLTLNETTSAPLDSVTIEIFLDGVSVKKIKSGKKAHYRLPHQADGVYSALCKRPGFADKAIPSIVIVAGNPVKLNITLLPL